MFQVIRRLSTLCVCGNSPIVLSIAPSSSAPNCEYFAVSVRSHGEHTRRFCQPHTAVIFWLFLECAETIRGYLAVAF